jgi:FtsH-binding integral membrane protein
MKMFGLIDPERRTLRLHRLLILNAIAVSLLVAATVIGHIAPRWIVIGVFGLYVLNFLIVRRASREKRANRVPILGWVAAFAFTASAVAAIVAFIRNPGLPWAIEAGIAVLLVGYIWFLVYRLFRRGGGEQNSR